MQMKLYHPQYYGMNGINKHKIGKYKKSKDRTSKYQYLATIRKNC